MKIRKKSRKIKSKTIGEEAVNILTIVIIFWFLLTYFKPELLLLDTTTAGGDTATHNYPAEYMYEYLIPRGKIIGWCPGWYGGFPLFQFYFPLNFVMMYALTPFVSIKVAFKLVTVLGTFMLPVCVLIAMKLMRFKFPIPAIAAVFTLPFLFMEANSMWGGNIPSTLAGEFSFSFSFALTVVFLGLLYRGINSYKGGRKKADKKFMLHNAVLFAFVILSHVYTMLFAGLTSLFFLIKRNKKEIFENFVYLFKTYGLALLLTAFWLLPLILQLEYTIAYNYVWVIDDLRKVFPEILTPFYGIATITFVWSVGKKDSRIVFIGFSLLVSLVLYLFASEMGVVDIRFVPFIQFFPLLIAAYGVGKLFGRIEAGIKMRGLNWFVRMGLPIVILIIVLVWVNKHVTYIDYWIKWNYEGFERKSLWNVYWSLNEFLKGPSADPRVVYEHSPLHDAAGSLRAFENLPLFSGRSTLEGLYMQSTITSPFSFYIQSEVSKLTSCPLPGYSCTSMDVTRAAPHLRMFNVKHIIARTEEAIEAYHADEENYKHVKSFSPYEIFELQGEHAYVVVPEYEPVFFVTEDWKSTSYEWFKKEYAIDVHLVFNPVLKSKLQTANDLYDLPRTKIESECLIQEHVYNEEVRFTTTCVGKPHIIKISYYPNWHVDGADDVYMVSPSFMLVYPTQENVRLYYGKGFVNIVSEALSYAGVILVVGGIFLAIFMRNQKVKRLLNL